MLPSAAILFSLLGTLVGQPWGAWCASESLLSDTCPAQVFPCGFTASHEPPGWRAPMFWCQGSDRSVVRETEAAETEAAVGGEPPGAGGSGASAAARLEQTLDDLTHAYTNVMDYTATLHKQERVGGRLLPQEKILVKFRKPYSLYMKWIGSARKGQEVLYARGWNEGKVRAHPGSFPDITVNLNPKSKLAMRADRHPATQASIGDVIDIMRENLQRAARDSKGAPAVADVGESTRFGARVRCFEITFPSAGYYGHRVRICVFVNTKLLSQVEVWDHSQRLLENYEYQNLRANVGLRARDFDPANTNYNF